MEQKDQNENNYYIISKSVVTQLSLRTPLRGIGLLTNRHGSIARKQCPKIKQNGYMPNYS